MESRLPKQIADAEDIARFLTQSGHFNTAGTKQTAFLPSPKSGETSVSRHGKEPLARLKLLGKAAAGGRNLYGAAILKAKDIREVSLAILPDEPPPYHAVIRNWPCDNDPMLEKAKHKELAIILASRSECLLF